MPAWQAQIVISACQWLRLAIEIAQVLVFQGLPDVLRPVELVAAQLFNSRPISAGRTRWVDQVHDLHPGVTGELAHVHLAATMDTRHADPHSVVGSEDQARGSYQVMVEPPATGTVAACSEGWYMLGIQHEVPSWIAGVREDAAMDVYELFSDRVHKSSGCLRLVKGISTRRPRTHDSNTACVISHDARPSCTLKAGRRSSSMAAMRSSVMILFRSRCGSFISTLGASGRGFQPLSHQVDFSRHCTRTVESPSENTDREDPPASIDVNAERPAIAVGIQHGIEIADDTIGESIHGVNTISHNRPERFGGPAHLAAVEA